MEEFQKTIIELLKANLDQQQQFEERQEILVIALHKQHLEFQQFTLQKTELQQKQLEKLRINFYLLQTFCLHLGSFLCCFFHYVSAKFHLWPSSGDFYRDKNDESCNRNYWGYGYKTHNSYPRSR